MPGPREGSGSLAGLTRVPREAAGLPAAVPVCLAEVPVSIKEAAPAWRMLRGPVNDALGYTARKDVYSGPLGPRGGGRLERPGG